MRRCSLLILPALLAAQPSYAGWASTKWGSSIAEVTRAMASTFPVHAPADAKPDPGQAFLSGGYRSGPMQFSVSYEFAAGKLVAVHLYLSGGATCSELASSLKAKYGKPLEETMGTPTDRIWQDGARNNRMKLSVFTDAFCTLDYEPLRSAATEGL